MASSSVATGLDFVRNNSISVVSVYATYEEVYEDDSVDIVYIATPHTFHKRDCLDAIRYKKHVLCGLPLAANAEEAEEVLVAARVQGVFIMEGRLTFVHQECQTRFCPSLSNSPRGTP
jgi:predicted dehydrogenase